MLRRLAGAAAVLAACALSYTLGLASQAPIAGGTFVAGSGLTIKVLADATTLGSGELDIAEITFPAGTDSGDHPHGSTEIFYVLSGELEHVVNGQTTMLRPGMVGFVRPPDRVRHRTAVETRALVLWVPGGEAARIVRNWQRRHPSRDLRRGEVLVHLETAQGEIDIAVDENRAPVTATNFLKYVDGGLYNGGRFHRATREGNYTPSPPDRPMMELIQGGIDPARRVEGFPPIPLERTNVTGLRHVAGTVSMARGAADSATSDFFILLDDQPSLDFGGRRFDDAQGAAAFGRVVFGLDAVRTIQQQPVNEQRLTPPVPIVKAERIR